MDDFYAPSATGINESMAIGPSASATGEMATAIGGWATATALNACSLGRFSRAQATRSLALCGGLADKAGSVVQGPTAKATMPGGRHWSGYTPTATTFRGQTVETEIYATTTDATQVICPLGDTTEIVIPAGRVMAFDVMLVAAANDGSRSVYARRFQGLVKRLAAGNVAQVGSTVETAIANDAGATMTATIGVNTGTQSLRVLVTGIAATTVRWCGTLRLTDLELP
jgi:hypothetical protein